jgi:hypothetical protein
MSPEEAAEMTKLQLDPANLAEELKAFVCAWDGALQFTGMEGMSQEEFLPILVKFGMTCRLPGFPSIFDEIGPSD